MICFKSTFDLKRYIKAMESATKAFQFYRTMLFERAPLKAKQEMFVDMCEETQEKAGVVKEISWVARM